MKQFIEYLLLFGNLNARQTELICGKGEELNLEEGQLYWEAGKIVRHIGFLTDGIIRVYYYNNKGEEITRYFIDNNHLILSGNTIDESYSPAEYLAAIIPCKLIVFTKADWKEISDTIVGWDEIIQKIIDRHHREKMERRSVLVSQDAKARYLDFLEKFPQKANLIPLTYIASYLGITASSLSRIRKSISKSQFLPNGKPTDEN